MKKNLKNKRKKYFKNFWNNKSKQTPKPLKKGKGESEEKTKSKPKVQIKNKDTKARTLLYYLLKSRNSRPNNFWLNNPFQNKNKRAISKTRTKSAKFQRSKIHSFTKQM